MTSLEDRFFVGMYGQRPPDDVHEEMVELLREMTLVAATRALPLDDIAEAAAARISVTEKVLWKVMVDGEIVRKTPFEVVWMHEQYIHKYKNDARTRYKELKKEVDTLSNDVNTALSEFSTEKIVSTVRKASDDRYTELGDIIKKFHNQQLTRHVKLVQEVQKLEKEVKWLVDKEIAIEKVMKETTVLMDKVLRRQDKMESTNQAALKLANLTEERLDKIEKKLFLS
jgi:outer membrane murein-binding lipoprotein Lpp